VLLFEFVLPVNEVLPKPSLLLESFSSLWVDYNLFEEILITTSVIYSGLLVGYLLVLLLKKQIISLFHSLPNAFDGLKIFKFFPAFFYALIFAFWFNVELWAEFLFAFIAVAFYLVTEIKNRLPHVKKEYIESAASLNKSQDEIYSKVMWKNIQPEVFNSMFRLNYYLWVIVLIYEFISNFAGIGKVYNSLLQFHDLSGLFALAIIISVVILISNIALKFIEKKTIFWKA
jgi:ABC-type nitrate/sulfonate/bicarbonate transport system permease component